MKAAAAGMLSAAMLLAPGCERRPEKAVSREEPVRRAAYLSLLARDCLDGRVPAGEAARYAELRRLAHEAGAGHAFWLGENDFAAMRRLPRAPGCGRRGEYARALDALARRIAEHRR